MIMAHNIYKTGLSGEMLLLRLLDTLSPLEDNEADVIDLVESLFSRTTAICKIKVYTKNS